MIKILFGGSPCTHWSIAQTKNRETTPSGLGWELFLNYLYAKRRFQPDFFLYENNKSASQAIKEQISKELSVDLMYINSALVSAQNRQRFYAFNWSVEQPADRCVILADILEENGKRIPTYGTNEKSRPITACYAYKGCGESSLLSEAFPENPNKQVRDYIATPINTTKEEKAYALKAQYSKSSVKCFLSADHYPQTGVAIPLNATKDGKSQTIKAQYSFSSVQNMCCYDSTFGASGVAIPTNDKAIPFTGKGKDKDSIKREYKVENGFIEIKEKLYPINLSNGNYRIRKLTVTECCRLQTLPDDYCKAVSNSQAYKGLGNGWTAEVIIHILNGALANVDRNEKIVVLSMYDGIGTGRYCLDKMGFKNVEYYASEIDKFAMKIANDNYPDIIQCGDAFQMRDNDFTLNDY